MIKIMFLCTGNTCRSQMAEGFARQAGGGLVEPHSAGLAPAGIVHPRAIAVMKEIDIDISGQKSKAIDDKLLQKMDIVITLCGNAEASCPVTPPGIKRLHWPVDDPVGAVGTDEETFKEFRRARDAIKARVIELINSLEKMEKHQD